MTTLVELDDVELLELTRGSSTEAYAVLYDRYVFAARRLARHLGQREEADDVVAESFAQVLDLLNRDKGPNRAFRAYLFTTIRHECGRRAKANKRVMPTDDESTIDSAVPFGGGELDDFETSTIRAAYESLPARWRTVLWHLDVEGRQPNELAPLLGLKANSVSALVYRARSGLREAYLHQHIKTDDQTRLSSCRDVRASLAGVVRRTAGTREQEKVHAHLPTCQACMAIYLDLEEVNRQIGTVGLPASMAIAAGGGIAVAVHGGGLANLALAVKGILLAVSAPVAAAALAATVVLSSSAVQPAAAAAPSQARAPLASAFADAASKPRAAEAPTPHEITPPTESSPVAPRPAKVPADAPALVTVHRTDGVKVQLGATAVHVGHAGVTVDSTVGSAAVTVPAELQQVVPDILEGAAEILAVPGPE